MSIWAIMVQSILGSGTEEEYRKMWAGVVILSASARIMMMEAHSDVHCCH